MSSSRRDSSGVRLRRRQGTDYDELTREGNYQYTLHRRLDSGFRKDEQFDIQPQKRKSFHQPFEGVSFSKGDSLIRERQEAKRIAEVTNDTDHSNRESRQSVRRGSARASPTNSHNYQADSRDQLDDHPGSNHSSRRSSPQRRRDSDRRSATPRTSQSPNRQQYSRAELDARKQRQSPDPERDQAEDEHTTREDSSRPRSKEERSKDPEYVISTENDRNSSNDQYGQMPQIPGTQYSYPTAQHYSQGPYPEGDVLAEPQQVNSYNTGAASQVNTYDQASTQQPDLYSQPPDQSYARPLAQGYGQQTTQSYAQSQVQGYDQPSAQGYDQPPAQGYGQAPAQQTNTYGQPVSVPAQSFQQGDGYGLPQNHPIGNYGDASYGQYPVNVSYQQFPQYQQAQFDPVTGEMNPPENASTVRQSNEPRNYIERNIERLHRSPTLKTYEDIHQERKAILDSRIETPAKGQHGPRTKGASSTNTDYASGAPISNPAPYYPQQQAMTSVNSVYQQQPYGYSNPPAAPPQLSDPHQGSTGPQVHSQAPGGPAVQPSTNDPAESAWQKRVETLNRMSSRTSRMQPTNSRLPPRRRITSRATNSSSRPAAPHVVSHPTSHASSGNVQRYPQPTTILATHDGQHINVDVSLLVSPRNSGSNQFQFDNKQVSHSAHVQPSVPVYVYHPTEKPRSEPGERTPRDKLNWPRQKATTNPYRPLPPINHSQSDTEEGYAGMFLTKRDKKFDYKPYTLRDYRRMPKEVRLGTLGPDLETQEFKARTEKQQRLINFGNDAMQRNKAHMGKAKPSRHSFSKGDSEVSAQYKTRYEYGQTLRLAKGGSTQSPRGAQSRSESGSLQHAAA